MVIVMMKIGIMKLVRNELGFRMNGKSVGGLKIKLLLLKMIETEKRGKRGGSLKIKLRKKKLI